MGSFWPWQHAGLVVSQPANQLTLEICHDAMPRALSSQRKIAAQDASVEGGISSSETPSAAVSLWIFVALDDVESRHEEHLYTVHPYIQYPKQRAQ